MLRLFWKKNKKLENFLKSVTIILEKSKKLINVLKNVTAAFGEKSKTLKSVAKERYGPSGKKVKS